MRFLQSQLACARPKSLLFLGVIFCWFFPISGLVSAKEKSTQFILKVEKGLITIQAENVSFKEILRELESKAGIKVKIFEGVADKNVTLKVEALPLFSLETILDKMSLSNSALVHDQEDGLIAVYVLPRGQDISKIITGESVIKQAVFWQGVASLSTYFNAYISGKEWCRRA